MMGHFCDGAGLAGEDIFCKPCQVPLHGGRDRYSGNRSEVGLERNGGANTLWWPSRA